MNITALLPNIRERFSRLYGEDLAPSCIERFGMLLGRYGVGSEIRPLAIPFSAQEVGLIAYADMLSESYKPGVLANSPLNALGEFLDGTAADLFSFVHLLPFYPSSSDDGFSVKDFRMVSSEIGKWEDVERFSSGRRVMFDLVLNHASRQGAWFADFRNDIAPGNSYFLTVDGTPDLSAVVRPRSHPLLSSVVTSKGEKKVWCTFSEDQVDLNYRTPDLLFEMLDVVLFYISHGARLLRLDAVGFLWKEIGGPCIHLPHTHEIIKLIRDLIEIVAPGVQIVTETNVPHRENISYLGNGDEAHLVYQFSLAPLLAHALLTKDASYLKKWLQELDELPANTSVLNFTASHDGVGLRPLADLLPEKEIGFLVDHTITQKGRVSYRAVSSGEKAPYELNITYFDLLGSASPDEKLFHERKFIASQAIMLALRGIPLVYFNSLFGTQNYLEGLEETGRARTINRKKWSDIELKEVLAPGTRYSSTFDRMIKMIKVRRSLEAFSPTASQVLLESSSQILAFERRSNSQRIICVFNLSAEKLKCPEFGLSDKVLTDALSGEAEVPKVLGPYEFRWLVTNY